MKMKVLIVDDVPLNRKLLQVMLRAEDMETVEAENGRMALAALEREGFGFVITDLLMPVMDGMTFLEVFRATPRFQHVPVIVVSAKDVSPEERDRLNRHTAAVLRKGNALESDLRRMLGSILMHDDSHSGNRSGKGAA